MLKLSIYSKRRWDREIIGRLDFKGEGGRSKGENVGEILSVKKNMEIDGGEREEIYKNDKKKEQAEGKPVFLFGLAKILLNGWM